jgi:EPS-associated MarR family transcriptional regulator
MNEHNLREDFFKILRVLSSRDTVSQRDLSGHLNISLGKTNYLLKSLIQKGFIKIKNFSRGDRKLKKVKYILTQKGLEERVRLTYHYLKLKEQEYLELQEELSGISE